MQTVEEALAAAQHKAEDLFSEVVATGLIQSGVLESELSERIRELANRRFGVRRHWHKRVVRCGENTLLTYHDDPPDRCTQADDVVYLDFGPLFGEWEADFGRTYVLGMDPRKHQLVHDITASFRKGKQLYLANPDLTAGSLYDFVSELAIAAGWEFGNRTAGHLIGHFPHEKNVGPTGRFSIRHGNPIKLRERDAAGQPRHWILEIHFVDRKNRFGGFFEELLTIGPT
ncbi:MAG TPA: M24 family metallopeptidase [Steroidobacteraceae bacterium]|nr:M24 family metallopeptidase [Steroidobacteraceae bacterium]